ncbi:hypothetical protein ABEP42_21665 [Priestia megaterium]|uniref:hypothetical protein n=1 Tax=Priestia megaterium TaxID=1404 RepID=UPI003172EA20
MNFLGNFYLFIKIYKKGEEMLNGFKFVCLIILSIVALAGVAEERNEIAGRWGDI